MTCPRCRTRYEQSRGDCPRCGAPRTKVHGTFQTSTVLISAGNLERVYRSVDEVPTGLRTQLLKSTNGAHAATILIADRRGRKEIARAMGRMPGKTQRRLMASLPEPEPSRLELWLTPGRRKAIVAVIAMLMLAAIGLLFSKAG